MLKLNRRFVAAVLIGAVIALIGIILSHGAYFGWAELFAHGTTLAALGATLALAGVGLAFCLWPRLRGWFVSWRGADFLVITGSLLAIYMLAFFLGEGLILNSLLELLRKLFLPAGIYLVFLLFLGLWALVRTRNPYAGLKVERGMVLLFFGLLLANVLSVLLTSVGNRDHDLSILASRFLVEKEQSVYTYASAAALALVGWFNWRAPSGGRAGRRGFGALFFILSLDEVAGFHEVIVDAMRRIGEELTGSMLAYLVLLALMLGLLGWWILRFLKEVSPRQCRLCVSGLALFFGGSVLVEAVSWAVFAAFGSSLQTPVILVYVLQMLEEGLELGGALMLLLFSLREKQRLQK